jgi:hypothetical protein
MLKGLILTLPISTLRINYPEEEAPQGHIYKTTTGMGITVPSEPPPSHRKSVRQVLRPKETSARTRLPKEILQRIIPFPKQHWNTKAQKGHETTLGTNPLSSMPSCKDLLEVSPRGSIRLFAPSAKGSGKKPPINGESLDIPLVAAEWVVMAGIIVFIRTGDATLTPHRTTITMESAIFVGVRYMAQPGTLPRTPSNRIRHPNLRKILPNLLPIGLRTSRHPTMFIAPITFTTMVGEGTERLSFTAPYAPDWKGNS